MSNLVAAQPEVLGMAMMVKGSTGAIYTVTMDAAAAGRLVCTCPDFTFRNRACKHVVSVLETTVEMARVAAEERA